MPIVTDGSGSGALAAQVDVEADLGRDLSGSEERRLPSLLSKATAIVIGYTKQEFDPVPDAVVAVTAGMVARALSQGAVAGVDSETTGPFTRHFSAAATSGDPWLSASDKLALRPYRLGGGVTSVQAVGERYDITPGV